VTQKLKPEQIERLYAAVRNSLSNGTNRLRRMVLATDSPEKVTAFRPEMAVLWAHIKKPSRGCRQNISATLCSTNSNYCPNCQNGGKLNRRPRPVAMAAERMAYWTPP